MARTRTPRKRTSVAGLPTGDSQPQLWLTLQACAEIFERCGWGFVVGDPRDDTLTLMNPAFAKMHGYTVKELLGKPIASIKAPDVRKELPRHLRRADRDGHDSYQSSHLRKDGTTFPAQVDVTALEDEDGRVLYRTVCVQDITERKRAEEAVRESEEWFRTL